jgi:CRISPR-associated protein Cas5h
MGVIAAILGRKRNTYYEELSSKNVNISIINKSDLKKDIHVLNYLKVIKKDHFNRPKNHTQIPFEILSNKNGEELEYIFIINTKDEDLYKELKRRLKDNEFVYPLSFGKACFNCYCEYLGEGKLIPKKSEDNFVKISSIVPSEKIKEIKPKSYGNVSIELMPKDFGKNRKKLKLEEYLVLKNNGSIEIKTQEYYQLNLNDKKENNIFM